MEFWKTPPIIKVYEALGAVADGRVLSPLHLEDSTPSLRQGKKKETRVASSDGLKKYDVAWDSDTNTIMANDNGSYWMGYLGYPSIAFLMKEGVLPYDEAVGGLLKGIKWKEINTKHKNDFEKTKEEIFSGMLSENCARVKAFGEKVLKEIEKLGIGKLGKRTRPPKEKGK